MAQTQHAGGDGNRDSLGGGAAGRPLDASTPQGGTPGPQYGGGGSGPQPQYGRPPASPSGPPTPSGGNGPGGGATAAGPDTPGSGLGSTGGADPRSAPTQVPQTVGDGRYQITHRLGRGGMAEVFAAQDLRLGRTVAVKLLRADLAEDTVARERFQREAHAVASLNHHAIVAVYDTGEEAMGGDTVPYIVMELVEGRTVRQLLVDEEPPPVDQALIIIAGVLEALGYSHQHGIVHRDIKPANVIITTQGAVKVMDFGIARALTGASSTMTQTGMVMGTPQYLSPEQALGKAVDHRSDLYATGCMLYELLTLRPPFTGDTPLSVVYQHVQDPPMPPSQANPRVPAMLDDLVLRSLAKEPDDRYQTADEFRAHLQHALRVMHGQDDGTGTMMLGQNGVPTTVLGAAAAPTMALRPGMSPTTPVEGTQVLGAYQGAGGAGGDEDGYGRDGGGGRNRGKIIAAVVAVLVVLAGVGIALALTSHSGGKSPTQQTTRTATTAPTTATSQPPTSGPTETQTHSAQPTYQQPTSNPTTAAPTTAAPTTAAPTTAAPTTAAPTTAAPTTAAPTTAAPTTPPPPTATATNP
ncbi:protein kinase domain-containing protein [Phaeacidiphilus oryzae]|uniref:protein kinase domain-containing protein n=1 Tax=Phaeacidiphilus oryzae TaxID=348818 RepID=UPI0007C7117D|nr:protein kinase [Phaeacidiphilus oryzae]